MKSWPSRSLVHCLVFYIGLTAIVVVGILFWIKLSEVPKRLRNAGNVIEIVRCMLRPKVRPPTPEETARANAEAVRLMEKYSNEFPQLRVVHHPVPDDQNGFLLLNQLSSDPSLKLRDATKELQAIIGDRSPWDPEAAKNWLSTHAALVAGVDRIASLKTRSSSGRRNSDMGFIPASHGKLAADVLLMKARLAAEAKEEERVLQLVTAAQTIASHYREVEVPSLLSETCVILIDLGIHKAAFTYLLPSIGRSADLGRWREVLSPRSYNPRELARVLRGEWNVIASSHLSIIFRKGDPGHVPDPENLAHALAAEYAREMTRLHTVPLRQVIDKKTGFGSGVPSHLSKKSWALMKLVAMGLPSWSKGYVRATCIFAQYEAALDLLMIEKTGAVLTPESAATITIDPYSGSPFLFDPATRLLSAPPGVDESDVPPLALPW